MLILNRKSVNSERNHLTVNSLFLECKTVCKGLCRQQVDEAKLKEGRDVHDMDVNQMPVCRKILDF